MQYRNYNFPNNLSGIPPSPDIEKAILSLEQKQLQSIQLQETILRGCYDVPTLVVILPKLKTSWKDKYSPARLVRNHFSLFFCCEFTGRLVSCALFTIMPSSLILRIH